MKIKTITTANIKNPTYNEKHQIFVGTHTGSFKRMDVFAEDPHKQVNLQTITSLNKHSRVTALDWGDKNEILIGRENKFVKVYDVTGNEFTSTIEFADGPIIGIGRWDDKLIAGLAGGKVQIYKETLEFLQTGDHLSRMRQCNENKNLIATGGKGRENNLKLWDLETQKKVFSSKNLPNDFLELEVPVWDSDLVFLNTNSLATCSRYGYIRVYDTRKQRRPVLSYVNEKEQLAYGCATAHENMLYVGTASGIVRAFDTRKMKTILHTYKGFTGSVTDIVVDKNGKYIFTSCLDRFVRVHCSETTVLQYQCYVKSKATKILLREYADDADQSESEILEDNSNEANDELVHPIQEDDDDHLEDEPGSDSEYEELFQNMQTIEEEQQERLRKKRKTKVSIKSNKISKKKK